MRERPSDLARVAETVDEVVESADLVGAVLEMFDLLSDLALTELSPAARETVENVLDAANDWRRARLTQGRLI